MGSDVVQLSLEIDPVRICTVPGCDRNQYVRGFCRKHYNSQRLQTMGQCTALDCTKTQFTRGLCRAHYERLRESEAEPCPLPDCEKPKYARGLCRTHYGRERRSKELCSLPDCEKPKDSLGLCSTHYSKVRRDRRPRWAPNPTPRICVDCGAVFQGRGKRSVRCAACRKVWQVHLSRVRVYGLTSEQFHEMNAVQGGACAICGSQPIAGNCLHVDHDHDTGRVRALLCHHCNTGLGSFKDAPDRLRLAADYLEHHNQDPDITKSVAPLTRGT